MKIENRLIRELINEFIGTMILVLIGDSILAVIIAGDNEKLAPIVGHVGWGTAIFVAVTIAGGVSAHLKPAVTLALTSTKKFPINKVPLYFAVQYLGSFVGAALVYLLYRDLIANFYGGVRQITGKQGTAPIFATYPREHVSTLTCFFDQLVGTGLLMLTAEAITDPRNFGGTPKHLHPLALGLMIMALIFGFSYNCMAPLNPARDIGPRIFTAIAGWGTEVFTYRNWNYIWVPIFGPNLGAIMSAWIYKVGIGDNFPDDEPKLRAAESGVQLELFQPEAQQPVPEAPAPVP
ncbi:unnamed protein product [Ixodes persulcatus]